MRSAADGGVLPLARSMTTSRPPRSITVKRLGGGRSGNAEFFLQGQHRERGLRRLAALIPPRPRSEEHTSELQSLMRISYAVFCLKKKQYTTTTHTQHTA